MKVVIVSSILLSILLPLAGLIVLMVILKYRELMDDIEDRRIARLAHQRQREIEALEAGEVHNVRVLYPPPAVIPEEPSGTEDG